MEEICGTWELTGVCTEPAPGRELAFRKPVLGVGLMSSLQVTVQCGVMLLRENEGEGLTGAEYVPELKGLYGIKLSSPMPLRC